MSSNSVCNHTRDKQIGLRLRGRPILSVITRMITEQTPLSPITITNCTPPGPSTITTFILISQVTFLVKEQSDGFESTKQKRYRLTILDVNMKTDFDEDIKYV